MHGLVTCVERVGLTRTVPFMTNNEILALSHLDDQSPGDIYDVDAKGLQKANWRRMRTLILFVHA